MSCFIRNIDIVSIVGFPTLHARLKLRPLNVYVTVASEFSNPGKCP